MRQEAVRKYEQAKQAVSQAVNKAKDMGIQLVFKAGMTLQQQLEYTKKIIQICSDKVSAVAVVAVGAAVVLTAGAVGPIVAAAGSALLSGGGAIGAVSAGIGVIGAAGGSAAVVSSLTLAGGLATAGTIAAMSSNELTDNGTHKVVNNIIGGVGTTTGLFAGGVSSVIGGMNVAATQSSSNTPQATSTNTPKTISSEVDDKKSSLKLDLQFFGKRDIKQIQDVSKQFKMDNVTRREFGDYVESKKDLVRNDKNFTYKELQEIAKEFLGVE